MRSQWLPLSFFFTLAGGFCITAGQPVSLAAADPTPQVIQGIDPVGEPKGFHKGDTVRYAVWVSPNGVWHVRTTTAKKFHQFKGKIYVDGGVITNLVSHDLERKGPFTDWWKLSKSGREIVVDFKTDRGLDGINFEVSNDAKFLSFNLHVDGKHQKNLIHVGRNGGHPDKDPFMLAAHYTP